MLKTLYHPHFEPEESWLRAMLLFYETVHSIIPEHAEYASSPEITTLCEKVEGAFVPLAPSEQDLTYDWISYHALTGVLRKLSNQGAGRDTVDARLDWSQDVPSLDLGETVRVHTDKMADMLAHDLLDFKLAEKQTDDPVWLRVDRRVADLVLSMLADRMAKNRPGVIYTSSDQEQSFAVAAKSELEHGQLRDAKATLASAILKAEIPADLADLPLNQYLDVRKRYEDKREVFQLAMNELQELYFKESFRAPEEFRTQLEHVVKQFSGEMQKLREQRFGRQVRRWAPIALGGVVSLAAAAITVPVIAVGAAGVSLAVQVLQTSQGEPAPATYKAKLQTHLVELDRDVRWNRNWLGRVLSW